MKLWEEENKNKEEHTDEDELFDGLVKASNKEKKAWYKQIFDWES